MFWTLAISLTVLVAATLASPFLRAFRPLPSRAAHDVEVYGSQLHDLHGDLGRGLLPSNEAAGARAEIGRRLLRAAAERDAAGSRTKTAMGRLADCGVAGLIVFACLAAIPLYDRLGQPDAADQPLAARLMADPGKLDMPRLLATAEARLRADPSDGRGWEAVLPVYLRAGRAADAVTAADNAIRLLGPSADRLTMKGEGQVQLASGSVTDEADTTFRQALDLDPANGPAHFYLALRLSQQGRDAEAASAWRAVVAAGPPDASWIAPARLALARAENGTKTTEASSAAMQPGPDAEQVSAAAALSPVDRTAMVQGMVAQLATRLEAAPNDPDGWMRLMRSYSVLGERSKAADAYGRASAVFASGSTERRSIDAFAAGLGLGERKAAP